ncbi:phytase [Ferrimonas balearica]|uniref:phytase n=1 Tax=Ferrimonas balearica TaxID=44012 RepID=UPI001C964FAD|nr:phytase [Ferrimonas balearica]
MKWNAIGAVMLALWMSPAEAVEQGSQGARYQDGWLLASEREGLVWQQGDQTRTVLPGRFEALAVAADLALTIELTEDRVVPVKLTATGAQALPPLPQRTFQVEWLCLQRHADSDSLYAWIGGERGWAEQWLMQSGRHWQPTLMRTLPVPPDASACAVDSAAQQLLVVDASAGVWRYPAAPHAPLERELLLAMPDAGLTAISIDEQRGLWLLDESGHLYDGDGNRTGVRFDDHGEWEGLAVAAGQALAYDDERGRYAWQPLKTRGVTPLEPVDAIAEAPAWVESDVADRPGDTMDDPAIWVHPTHPERSRIIGTNKRWGLLSFDMAGNTVQALAVGRVNNVDIRQGVKLGGQLRDVGVASNRDGDTLTPFLIDAEGELALLPDLPTDIEEIYGLCLYQPANDELHVIANGKSGEMVQYRLDWRDEVLRATELRRLRLPSQPEGCVADDRAHRLFAGEEDAGIWLFDARPDGDSQGAMIAEVGPNLVADVEGMDLYHGDKGYLVVSSQGNDSYVLYDSEPPYAYRGRMRIGNHLEAGIDGSAETDGLAVTAAPVGSGGWASGMLVVQDGRNRMPDGFHNFKWLPFSEVLKAAGIE